MGGYAQGGFAQGGGHAQQMFYQASPQFAAFPAHQVPTFAGGDGSGYNVGQQTFERASAVSFSTLLVSLFPCGVFPVSSFDTDFIPSSFFFHPSFALHSPLVIGPATATPTAAGDDATVWKLKVHSFMVAQAERGN